MNESEQYLDNLLKSIIEATDATPSEEVPEEAPVIEEPMIEEEPVIEEEPIVEEEPIIEEEPTIEEEPIVEDELMIEEEPAIEDEPVIKDEPIIEEEPIIEKEPVIEEEPMIEDEPIVEEEPVIEEEPILEEVPVDENILHDDDISNLLDTLGALNAESQPAPDQEIALEYEELQNMAEALGIIDESEQTGEDAPAATEPTETAVDATADVTELLDQIAGDDELDEINNLLKKNDNNEAVDDDLLAMLENASDTAGGDVTDDVFAIEEPLLDEEEEEDPDSKKKKSRKERKAEKKAAQKDKKPGLFAKLLGALTEEEELPEEAVAEANALFAEESAIDAVAAANAENQEILNELEEEDAEKDGKKGKKGKKDKGKSKEKKPKEKKPKKEKPEKIASEPKKKLSKRHIAGIGIVCASMGALIISVAYFYPYYNDVQGAKSAYLNRNYEESYECLVGHTLNKDGQELFDKTVLLLRLDRKYQSYLNHSQLGMELEAFNALLQGVEAAEEYRERAAKLGVANEYEELARQIEETLSGQYGVSLQQALSWLAIDDAQVYSRTINDYLFGTNTLNLQTSDGKPYVEETPAEDAEQSTVPEQEENSIISGEEAEF